MTTARSIDDLYEGFSPEERQEIEQRKRLLIMEYTLLSELRKTRNLTQQQVAELMEVGQSAISKIEGQNDILIRTLERYVKALGGHLEVRAKFPDAEVTLRQFTE